MRELDRITGTWRKLGRIIRDATWISNSSTSVHFFCFDWANRPLLVCHLILPPTTPQMMTFRSRILRPGKRRNCLGRDVRRLETSDKMNGSTFILLPEKKEKKPRRHSWRKCVYPSRAFLFLHVHLHGNVTWSFNRSSFYFDDIHSPLFSVWPIFQMIGGKWCGFIFKVDWMPWLPSRNPIEW
jgi:hypothetical protein